ncbi:hypothetical protein V6K52_17150 [Knoellia sp. S7-12]|uniref:hypothetical protein n=1 Tax=Knoellia sp. S7-12 TaxID=3126698 RepID=UPI0033683978
MTAAVIAGVVLVTAGGTWAMGSILSDDGATAKAAPSTSTSVTATATASPTTTPSTSPSASTPDPSAASDEARAACVAQVGAAEKLATAVAGSALHWKQHTDAYLDRIDRRISLAETKRIYAASRAHGLADEKAVAATTKAFTATGAACVEATTVLPNDAAVGACSTRLAALDGVRTTGTTVQDQWSVHMRMMAGKAHTETGLYHERWVKAVNSSRTSLAAYAKAAAAVAKAPACA